MANHDQKPHFILLPFMAQGHMIPMVDTGRLLANTGVKVTVLTTPHNGARFQPVFDRAITSGLNISVVHLRFPCVEAGLPEGCENFDMLPSMDEDAIKFFNACDILKHQVEELFHDLNPRPSCLVADMCFPWTTDLALNWHIPRIIFHGTSIFSLLCFQMMAISKCYENVSSDFDYFVIPDLPDRIEFSRVQFLGTGENKAPDWSKLRGEMKQAEVKAFGIIANTFQELEPLYINQYTKVKGKKVWPIGPVSLSNKDGIEKVERGDKSSIALHECLKWLDSHDPGSILYVCLGSVFRLGTMQLVELGLALEASKRPFIWVVRHASIEFQKWLVDENYEERVNGRGLLIRGWAPQVLILSHPSVGGFLTHCGWNSTLEGITAGVAMITWPLSGEQFSNEKFVVHVMKTGVRVGVEEPVHVGREEKMGVMVRGGDIERAIDGLMDDGEEAQERRLRAKKFGEMAKRAMEEGGSSYCNIKMFIQDVMKYDGPHLSLNHAIIL